MIAFNFSNEFNGHMTTKLIDKNLMSGAYSHGLESIYAVETIDLSSVRVISPVSATPKASVDMPAVAKLEEKFFFARNVIPPFFLKESIEILKLSPHAERFLRSLGHELIQDLLSLDFADISFLRGLGQGHIEEIKTKLKEFINGRALNLRPSIDYISWARALFRGMDKRVVGVVFERFGLIDFLPLNLSERTEIKKLSQEKKQEWFHQFKETCRAKHDDFDKDLNLVLSEFVRPWILSRGGFAGEAELAELAWRLGDDKDESEKVLALFSELLCNGAHPFFRLQESPIKGIYVADTEAYRMLSRIQRVLKSYFYKNSIQYSLSELVAWVEREFACAWINLPSGALLKVLDLSKDFEILQPAVDKHHIVRMAQSLPGRSS